MLSKLGLRRYERRLARNYMHAMRFSECWGGFFCWTCAWRSMTGYFDRERAAFVRRADALGGDIPVVKVALTDEQLVAGLRGRMLNQMRANGEVLCSTDPDYHEQHGRPCLRCGAAI